MDELTCVFDPLSKRWDSREISVDPEFRCGLGRVRVMRVRDGLIGVRAGAVAWERLRTEPVGLVYLGSDGDHDFCVIDDDGAEMADLDFIDVRAGVADLDNADIQLVWPALALTAWHRRALFCERCGSALESANYGRKRVCANGHEVFARMDPAVIMGIINGAGELLVARNRRWPVGRISVLAGFVEAGETFEAAVRREVWEEAGVHVGAVEYAGSQPWPFPRSMMVAFYGYTADREVRPDGDEIVEAFFIGKDELRARVDAGELSLPSAASVGRALVMHWLCG